MIMIDTSAWIEFLRDTGTTPCRAIDELLACDIAICDVISMEVLAGARDERHLTELRGLLARATLDRLDQEGPGAKITRHEVQAIVARMNEALSQGNLGELNLSS